MTLSIVGTVDVTTLRVNTAFDVVTLSIAVAADVMTSRIIEHSTSRGYNHRYSN